MKATLVREGPQESRRRDMGGDHPLDNGEAIALLREVVGELRQIRALLETKHPPKKLSRDDRERLAHLLPAIGGVFGSDEFVARDVVEAEAPGLRLVTAELSAKGLGRLLRRAVGEPIQGYLVEHVGTEVGASLWRIKAVSDFLR